MSPDIELNLTLILFLPWFVILTVLFWKFPREPKDAARRAYDVIALVVALGLFLASVYWAQAYADPAQGKMWKQILATALGYAVYLGAMAVAFVARRFWLRRRTPARTNAG
ncbi:hypothetical protein LY625_05125 [Lysobacter sp. GX 14042]|uniref:hypothetical protein n=1 Tax=Lysobacter sp. GX 14042 TaxID=2907155 RepID=UPI001F31A382|nr:hypothetical protein [Lysobacter sp. GX 14042]MCE7032004.1 hypothetical protein [Lysobacter sp. GX 14042]